TGTRMVRSIVDGAASPNITGLTTVDGAVAFFSAYSIDAGYELWRSDGTSAGTFMVRDNNPGTANATPTAITSVGGLAFFAANVGAGLGLWRSDGTSAGTY